MTPHIHRRAALGLSIRGPFSRNRRKRRSPALLASLLLTGLVAVILLSLI